MSEILLLTINPSINKYMAKKSLSNPKYTHKKHYKFIINEQQRVHKLKINKKS